MFKSLVYVLMFTFLLQHYYASARSFNNYWLLGYHSDFGLPFGGTDFLFANDSLVSINYHNREMSFDEECASISDSSGNLLFYTNGAYIANALDDTMMRGGGQISISPYGEWYSRFNAGYFLDLFNFDRCSGTFTNWINISAIDSTLYGGCAFAGNSKYLYVTNKYYLYQSDITAPDIAATKDTIAVYDGFQSPFSTTFYLAGLAADNKIYINSSNGVDKLLVINYPDSLGSACDIQQHAISLPTFNSYTMPDYPNYTLCPVVDSICHSLTTGITDNAYTKNLNLRINPNPAQGMFYVNYQLPTGTNAGLYLYNTLGGEVMRKKLYWYFGYLQIDASGLNNGSLLFENKNPKGECEW